MSKQSDTICGIDITRDYICIAQYEPEEAAIDNIIIKYIDTSSSDNIADAMKTEFKNLIQEVKIQNNDVICSLPSEYAIIKKILLDADIVEEDVNESIEWELSQQLIGSVDEYVYDHHRLSDLDGSGFKRFLGVAYKNSAVDDIAGLMRSSKLQPIVVDLDIFALLNAFELNYPQQRSGSNLLILAEEKKVKMVLVSNGDFVDLDIFEFGVPSSESDNIIQELKAAIDRFLGLHPQFAQQQVMTYLSGPMFTQPDFSNPALQSIENAALFFPFENITFKAHMSEDDLKRYSPQMAVAVGLAIRGNN